MLPKVEETCAARHPNLGQEYSAFLYATIGVDANGSAVSVLSAMARANLDPWHESQALADLSASAAARRLGSLIEEVLGGSIKLDDPGQSTDRLIKLLPRRARAILPTTTLRKSLPGFEFLAQPRTAFYLMVALIALFAVANWFGTSPSPVTPPKVNPAAEVPQSTAKSEYNRSAE